MNILRFITAGSVDDGKSTLIGRLLYDSKSILADQLEALEQQSKNKNEDGIDLAILTDGLRAEREQGITIDVAYRYFATPKRKFIIADAPGHTQYTRNMITGASNSQLIIILVDARNGVTEQTRRHSIIASLLNIPEVVVAVNKMDLVGYSEETFNSIKDEYQQIATHLGLKNVHYFPISAFVGDNIVNTTQAMAWYKGVSLLDFLETVAQQKYSELAQESQLLQQQLMVEEQAIQEESRTKMDTLLKKVKNFIKDYGKQHDYDFILGANDGGSVHYGKADKDITADIVKALNEKK